eukprot:TRINITY_DN1832_c0_g2_i1.p1 TRINITY_DN1832_c0_g2~~TRINITY_DN1832_c0_g2_i1.p1  ORF type:complete len:173 (-),score=52.05 TRINITY_DN1832_c0_g2_i1:168-686(-)
MAEGNGTSKNATEALTQQLTTILERTSMEKDGFEVTLQEENIYKWHVKLGNFEGVQLAADIQMYNDVMGRDHVLLEVVFPSSYPERPPFIRVVYPRFHQWTGHITIGGSICVRDLTMTGWQQDYDLSCFFVMVRNLLMEGGALLNMDDLSDYSEEEARAAFQRVAKQHGWDV